MILDNIKDRIGGFQGKFGLYYIDLFTGESCSAGNCDVFAASGGVKMLTLLEAFKRLEEGTLCRQTRYRLEKKDYIARGRKQVKTLGALEFLHQGTELTVEDLYRLNTTVSDNMAFNILLRMFGAEKINETLEMLGFEKTRVNREIYDTGKIAKGIENYISLEEMANLLYRMQKGQLISRRASEEMIEILKGHQKNSIIPYYFNEMLPVAHQTGTDDGVILDLGIIFSKRPFILCMAAEAPNTRNAECIMRDLTLMCYKNSNPSEKMD